jgi:hypothetical protein
MNFAADSPQLKLIAEIILMLSAGLEYEVDEMREEQIELQSRPNKNYLTALMSLVVLHIALDNIKQALNLTEEIILQLEELSMGGRWDFKSILAQALANKSNALLKRERFADAQYTSDHSVRLYENLLERGASQFKGQLANALFKRAESNIRGGNENSGADDLRRALAISQEWLDHWYGECNIQRIFIENALQTLSYLSTSFLVEKRILLETIRGCIWRASLTNPRTEALTRDEQILQENWSKLRNYAIESGSQWDVEFPIQQANKNTLF